MRTGLYIGAAAALGVFPTPAFSDAPMQPPMNSLQYAFYDCGAGAFEIDYDSDTPTQATIVTSDHNRRYELKRVSSDSGVEFSGGGVKFWTDGKKVSVEGIKPPLENCRRKGA